jgi:Ca2+-binding RTX toxin-like protein
MIRVASGVRNDRVVNSTGIRSTLNGGATNDLLIGGRSRDIITGGTGADVIMGMNGSDQIFARDLLSDTSIDCDGGTSPGAADEADLDLLPKDPDSRVTNCETKTRH